MGEVIDENGLARHIRYRHQDFVGQLVERDQSLDHRGRQADSDEAVTFTANFLWMCQGYYRHSEGYTPEWEGMDSFKGRIVHPQTWPDDLDIEGKKVVVIGSGATAATLIPAIAGRLRARHHAAALADLFQHRPQRHRTGRHAAATPGRGGMDPRDRAPQDPVRSGHLHPPLLRGAGSRQAGTAGRHSRGARSRFRGRSSRSISRRPIGRGGSASPSFPTATCSRRIKSGKASVVTDEIDRFTRKGILLKSGERLEADIIVTATGFNLNVLGDIAFTIDGKPLDFARDRHLSRHDVHRRAEHGLGVRLFPGELDAAHRSGGGFRLPPAGAHEEQGRQEGRAGAAAAKTTTCRCCPGSIRRISIPAT